MNDDDARLRSNRGTRPTLRLKLFGLPSLADDDRPLRLALKRGYALLAYLAIESRAVPRDHIAQILWPDAAPAVGRARLRRLIYRIEEVCGRGLIATHEDGLALTAESLACDAVEFRRAARSWIERDGPSEDLAEVAVLVRAACEPLLEGLSYGSDDFDDWVRTQRIEHEHLLSRTLVRIAEAQRSLGALDQAADTLERLLRLDPYCEPAYVQRMAVAAAAQDAAAVEATFMRCADALRAEFGCKPAPSTEKAYLELRASIAIGITSSPVAFEAAPLDIRFAGAEHGAVAYAVFGHGTEALVVIPGFVSHIEIAWEHPGIRDVLGRLAQHFEVILFDRRGVGLSERLSTVSSVESTAADVLTILDAMGMERAWLFGSSEGGPAAISLAALHPARVSGLVLFGAMARGSRDADYPWALPEDAFDRWMRALVAGWGGPANIETFAPAVQDDRNTRAWWARLLRHAASPASLRTVLAGLRDADVRALLPLVQRPTLILHRRGDRAVRFAAGEHLARSIRGARFLALEGSSHWWWVENRVEVAKAILDFVARQACPETR